RAVDGGQVKALPDGPPVRARLLWGRARLVSGTEERSWQQKYSPGTNMTADWWRTSTRRTGSARSRPPGATWGWSGLVGPGWARPLVPPGWGPGWGWWSGTSWGAIASTSAACRPRR